jgi:hypothetical protein
MQKASIASLIVILFCIGNVHAELTDEYEDAGSGTGFFVSADGLIATCYHVVKDAELIQVEYKNKSYKAHTITGNEGNDIAIIKIEGEFPFFELAESETVKLGDDVYTVGYPSPRDLGIEPKLTTGTVSASSGLKDDPTYYQISVPIQPGNSGGPLITTNGLVVGVISATIDAKAVLLSREYVPQNINYAVKSEYLKILLEIAKKKLESSGDPKTETKKGISREESVQRILRVILKRKKRNQNTNGNIQKNTKQSSKSPQVWEEELNALIERDGLIKAVQKINPDDPFDNYNNIKYELPTKFREWMDSWYQTTYAAWLSRGGGMSPGNIKGNPTPYEQEFKSLKKVIAQENPAALKSAIEYLSYTQLIKSKITAKGYELLIEQYPDEYKDWYLNKEQSAMRNAIHDKYIQDAISGSSFPFGEIIFHDSIGFVHTDPTVSDSKLLLVKIYKMLENQINKNENETTYLYLSLVTKDPYLIKVPKNYLSGEEIKKK